MIDQLQPGMHLDADQMGAFAEGVLPAHERESALAHLAVCAGCREVLALALPEMVPVAEPRRAWWIGWGLVWPGAAAVAAVLLVAVVLRRPQPQPVVEVARVEPAPVVAVAPSAVRVPKAPPLVAAARAAAAPAAGAVPPPPKPPARAAIVLGQEKVVAPANALGAAIDGAALQDLPVEGRSSAFLRQAPEASAIHGSAYGQVMGGIAGGTGQAVSSQARVAGPSQQSQMAAAPMAPAVAPQMAAAPPPVSVDALAADASEMNTEMSAIAAAPMRKAKGGGLPGGRAIVSTAAANGAVLAIDTAGVLFLSVDAGGHWKAVPAVWKGRAVSVGFVAPPAPVPAAPPKPVYTLKMTAGTASVAGTVQDASGAAVPGAAVSVTGGVARTAKADGAGRYRIQGLPPGPYAVEASAPGFMTQRVMVTLAAGQVDQENLKLAVGSQAETVTVETAPMKRQTVPVFSLVAADGGRWVSADGVVWVPGL